MPSIVRSTPLSCTSFSFPMLSLAQALQVIVILDLDGVDLCIANGARDVRAEAVISDATGLGRKHRQICQDFGLEVYDVFAHIGSSVSDRPINIADPSTIVENRVILSCYFEYAQAAGSPGVTISPGLLDPLDAHGAFMRAASELSWACEQARSFGIELSVEPHLGFFPRMLNAFDRASATTLTKAWLKHIEPHRGNCVTSVLTLPGLSGRIDGG